MAITSNYPAIRPSLNLDFANAKALDPRITFSRASAATYYDGKTVAKAEENLLTYSQQITAGAGAWAGQGLATGTTVNSAQAPDATVTASVINVTSGAGGVRYYSTIPAGTYTVSVYIRSVSGSTDFAIDFENLYSTSFTLSSVWQRVTATVTFAVTRAWIDFQISAPGIFEIWGAQLEQRSQATAYTPTTTQPITNYIPVLQTAPAGVPRFDHNPVTGESLGLLVEEQRTNLLLYSEQFDNTYWSKTNATIIPNAGISPDGTLSADIFVSSGTLVGNYYRSVTLTSGLAYTYSAYFKQYGTDSAHALYLNDSSSGQAVVTITASNGVLTIGPVSTSGPFSAGSATIASVGNGWYRVAITATFTGGTGPAVALAASSTKTGYNGIYIWGAQLEAGSFPTSYIKTDASQVTRAADLASMTGTNFSSWYRPDEGTFVYKNRPTGLSSTDRYHFIVSETQSVIPNSISSRTYNAGLIAAVYIGSSVQSSFSYGGMVVGKENSIALAYKTNNFAFSIDGSAAATDTSGLVPGTLSRFDILSNSCQHMAHITYYPKRLSNAQLQALTA